jgi:hypothetical protein
MRNISRNFGFADDGLPAFSGMIQKKAGLMPGFCSWWPREADTITFQEG